MAQKPMLRAEVAKVNPVAQGKPGNYGRGHSWIFFSAPLGETGFSNLQTECHPIGAYRSPWAGLEAWLGVRIHFSDPPRGGTGFRIIFLCGGSENENVRPTSQASCRRKPGTYVGSLGRRFTFTIDEECIRSLFLSSLFRFQEVPRTSSFVLLNVCK